MNEYKAKAAAMEQLTDVPNADKIAAAIVAAIKASEKSVADIKEELDDELSAALRGR